MGDAKTQNAIQRNISYHAWNKDQSLVALSPNSSEVWIFKTKGSTESDSWGKEPAYKLTEHTGYVSGIDWCHETNSLVTSSHDRNVFVWTFSESEDTWKPKLVLLRINRAATDVKWSPNGKKFAVSSGAKVVPICNFDESNDWWVSKHVKKHKSTVNSVAWSPCSKYIVTGGCDFKCRIMSAFVEEVDSPEPDAYTGMWKKQNELGEELAVYDCSKAWVNSVSWSPDGMRIAFAGHGSSMHFAHLTDGSKTGNEQTIFINSLPFLKCEFLTNDTLIAVGFDNNPVIFVNNGSGDSPDWKELIKVDKCEKVEKKVAKKGFGNAFSKFQEADSKGGKFGKKIEQKECLTLHKNTILDLKIMADKKVSTSALDGRLLTWDLSPIAGFK